MARLVAATCGQRPAGRVRMSAPHGRRRARLRPAGQRRGRQRRRCQCAARGRRSARTRSVRAAQAPAVDGGGGPDGRTVGSTIAISAASSKSSRKNLIEASAPCSWRVFPPLAPSLRLLRPATSEMLLTSASALGLSPGSAPPCRRRPLASSSTSAQFATRAGRATMSSLAGDGRADGDIPAPARRARARAAGAVAARRQRRSRRALRDPDGDAYATDPVAYDLGDGSFSSYDFRVEVHERYFPETIPVWKAPPSAAPRRRQPRRGGGALRRRGSR